MTKIIIIRGGLVLLQILYVILLSNTLSAKVLGTYYQYMAYAFVLATFFISYPEYLFHKCISRRLMNRWLLGKMILIITSASGILLFCMFFTSNIFIIFLSVVLMQSTGNIARIYLNVVNLKEVTIYIQIFEALLKFIFLYALMKLQIVTIVYVISSQYAACAIALFLIYALFLNSTKATGANFTEISSQISFSEIPKIIFNASCNSLYTNFLKIYLAFHDALEVVGLIGLAQQVSGNIVQTFNAVLQIQYGNQILRGKQYFIKSLKPSLVVFISLIPCIIFLHILILPYFGSNLASIPLSLLIMVYFFEAYIIPVSMLTKFYVYSDVISNIMNIHVVLAVCVVFSVIIMEVFFHYEVPLILGSCLTCYYGMRFVREVLKCKNLR